MSTKNLKIKSKKKILTCKILFLALLANLGLTILAPAANAENFPIISNGNSWNWDFSFETNRVRDLTICASTDCDDDEDIVVGDLYDGFGRARVDELPFDWELSETYLEGEIVDNEVFIPGDDSGEPDTTYTITLADNNITYLINSVEENNLRIFGNLGSDGGTRFITLGGRQFSYEMQMSEDFLDDDGTFYVQNFMPSSDPILLWEISANASLTSIEENDEVLDTLLDSYDDVNVSLTGNMLQVKHYAFAYRINGAIYNTMDTTNDRINNQNNTDQFFTQFLAFVNEDPTRTDIFTYNFINLPAVAAAPAPAPVYVRQTSNLTFAQSLYASDTLSDPDGQLRKTVDQIMAKYGSLIK
jgi:hypothetical protein